MPFQKGHKTWNKGRSLSRSHKRKLSEAKRKEPTRYWLGKKLGFIPSGSFKKGNIPWNRGKKGIHLSPNTELKKGYIPWNKGKKLSEQHIKNISLSHIGIQAREKCSTWKGGITPLTKQIRHCFRYRQWRSDIFTRDDYTCVLCNKRGGWIEADHYPKRFADIFSENQIKDLEEALNCEEFWNLNNGRTLCKNCHNKKK